jgi:hypothetical protein
MSGARSSTSWRAIASGSHSAGAMPKGSRRYASGGSCVSSGPAWGHSESANDVAGLTSTWGVEGGGGRGAVASGLGCNTPHRGSR